MANDRDTKFAGFAKRLLGEMLETDGYIDISGRWDKEDKEISTQDTEECDALIGIIARRVYDLVESACGDISIEQSDARLSTSGMMAAIDDMAEWPPTYGEVILGEKPIAYYPLATDTKDHSGHGHHAIIQHEESE